MMEMFHDTYTWMTLSFLMFAYIVYRYGGPAINGALDKRIAEIKTDIETAENLRVEAQEMLAQYQRKQRDAAVEADKILKDAQNAAKKIKANAEEELADVLARREKQLEERLNRMQQNAMDEIRAYAAALSMQTAELLVTEKLDKTVNTKLIDKSISGVGAKLN
jgi:F-type H+-transporting ATPase subunit b